MGSANSGAVQAPDTEQRIFDAALTVFARKGRDGARLQEIADHAGINRALLHYYFRTKSQLYEAVFEHGCRQFMTGLSQSLRAEQGFEDSLRTFVYGYIDYIYEHQEMARLMLNECLCGGGVLERHLTAAIAAREEVPGLLLEDRAAGGDGRGRDTGGGPPAHAAHDHLGVPVPVRGPAHGAALPFPGGGRLRPLRSGTKSHIVDLLLEGGLRPPGLRGSPEALA